MSQTPKSPLSTAATPPAASCAFLAARDPGDFGITFWPSFWAGRVSARYLVPHFLIVGLSHIFQRHAWVEFFVWLRERGHAGVFVHGFMSLWFGSMILAFHNVWSGLPTVLP